jgi:PPM family protein phosphatase
MGGRQLLKTRIAFANVTDLGLIRQQNEDRAIVCDPGKELASKMGYLIALADGMGGHAAGEIAAEIALRELVSRFYSFEGESDPGNILRQVVGEVNAAVFEEARSRTEFNEMGTTLVCAVIKDNWISIANVGDSRAYLVRSGMALRLTKDHTWAEENGLSEEEGRRTPFRSVITRAVGTAPEVKVDVFSEFLKPGDVVLLCSDGLTKHVPDQLIGKTISRSLQLRNACIALVQLAKQGVGTDNITTVAARMTRVRERTGNFKVSRAFPGQIDRAQRTIAHRKRTVIIGIALVCVCALLAGLWMFGVLSLDTLPSPMETRRQASRPETVAGDSSDARRAALRPQIGDSASSTLKKRGVDTRAESTGLAAEQGRPLGNAGARGQSDSSGIQPEGRNTASSPKRAVPTSGVKKATEVGSIPVPLSGQRKREGKDSSAVNNSTSSDRGVTPDSEKGTQQVGKQLAKPGLEIPTRQVPGARRSPSDSAKKNDQQTMRW